MTRPVGFWGKRKWICAAWSARPGHFLDLFDEGGWSRKARRTSRNPPVPWPRPGPGGIHELSRSSSSGLMPRTFWKTRRLRIMTSSLRKMGWSVLGAIPSRQVVSWSAGKRPKRRRSRHRTPAVAGVFLEAGQKFLLHFFFVGRPEGKVST